MIKPQSAYNGNGQGQNDLFLSVVNSVAKSIQSSSSRPVLVKPDGSPLKLSDYQYKREAAKRTGSMKTWIPRRLTSSQEAAMDREAIVERSIDLVNNDPHAAGIADTFATTIVGAGLNPHATLDAKFLGLEKEEVKTIQKQQKNIYKIWSPFADAGGRMTAGHIHYLAQRMIMQFGEYLFLLPMLKDTSRPYSLAVQAINPLRLKTPVELQTKENIKDGVEIGKYGEPIAYWIKKTNNSRFSYQADIKANFLRIPAKKGHRWNVLHGFFATDPEQYRGMPFFAPAMKFFRDLHDYLNAELVSNIVTAAFSMFIETGSNDPLFPAQNMATITETGYKSDGTPYDQRYQEMTPGSVMYGNDGEKPHVISAQRPGATFEPFIRSIAKSIALSMGIPHPVLFKDFQGMNFASYRSAMLEAWRVFKSRRTWLGQGFCQNIWRMLMEEAYLRGDLKVKNFYQKMWPLTQAEWIGPPKGQIEPIKEVQADILEIQNNLASREEKLLERGRELTGTFDQLEDEQGLMEEKGLNESKLEADQIDEKEEKEDGTD